MIYKDKGKAMTVRQQNVITYPEIYGAQNLTA
jgi:hypothetical protein